MMHQALLRSSQARSPTLSSLLRQLHIGSGSGRCEMLEKVSPLIRFEVPNSEFLPSLNNSNDCTKYGSLSLTPLVAQARQQIIENPFQYRIRPSIGIPPELFRRPEYRTPVSSSIITPLGTPCGENKNIMEDPNPSSGIIEKQAARLVVIRRRKMNKHKLRKLRKKMKYTWAKIRLRRAIRKEKAYLNSKMELINAARKFDAKEYVASIIKKAKEEPIPYKWTDPLMPEWYKEQEMKKEAWQKRYQKMINLYLNKSITIDFKEKKK